MAAVFATAVMVAGVWASTAQAQLQHSLSGNARAQIGDGLPIPIGSTAAPNGRIKAKVGAVVTQTTGPDPKKLSLSPSQLTAPGNNLTLGVWMSNPNVFQVRTMIPIAMPAPGPPAKARFFAAGRTGAPVVSFCPGDVVTPAGNPGCANPFAGSGIHGRLVYTKTKNQFGGTMASSTGTASADVALNGSGVNVKSTVGVKAIFAFATPVGTGAGGGPFGGTGKTTPNVPNPSGSAKVAVTAEGNITNVTSSNLGLGAGNTAFSYGGPWTTGKVTVSVLSLAGPVPEVFVLQGFDRRVNGAGPLSMVSGSVSYRPLSGNNGNRGWLNWHIGGVAKAPATPAIPVAGLAAVGGLLALAGGYVLRRRQS
jgi:hypothetical protein